MSSGRSGSKFSGSSNIKSCHLEHPLVNYGKQQQTMANEGGLQSIEAVAVCASVLNEDAAHILSCRRIFLPMIILHYDAHVSGKLSMPVCSPRSHNAHPVIPLDALGDALSNALCGTEYAWTLQIVCYTGKPYSNWSHCTD